MGLRSHNGSLLSSQGHLCTTCCQGSDNDCPVETCWSIRNDPASNNLVWQMTGITRSCYYEDGRGISSLSWDAALGRWIWHRNDVEPSWLGPFTKASPIGWYTMPEGVPGTVDVEVTGPCP